MSKNRVIEALKEIKTILETLHVQEKVAVIHSLLDSSANNEGGYQLIANFVNDRYFLEKGAESSAEYWHYLADTRTARQFNVDMKQDAKNWITVESYEQ